MNKPLFSGIETITHQALDVCEVLERGQADRPLAEHFNNILQSKNNPLSIVVLALNQTARSAVLSWLYGKEFSSLSVKVIEQLGLVELSLSEKGYHLQQSDTYR